MTMILLLCKLHKTRWKREQESKANEGYNYSSPQGRIFQVEYTSEAVKQGSVVVGIVSKTHAVLVAVKVQSTNALLPHSNSPPGFKED